MLGLGEGKMFGRGHFIGASAKEGARPNPSSFLDEKITHEKMKST